MSAGDFLAARRTDLGLTVEIAAARAHVTPEAWRAVEAGDAPIRDLTFGTVTQLALALDCSLDAIAAAVLRQAYVDLGLEPPR